MAFVMRAPTANNKHELIILATTAASEHAVL